MAGAIAVPRSVMACCALCAGLLSLTAAASARAAVFPLSPALCSTVHPGGSNAAPARIIVGGNHIPYVGGSADVAVDTVGVAGLAAATLIVGYDPAILEVTGCRRGSAFDFGLCNTKYDRDGNGEPDAVRFNVVSIEGRSGTPDEPLNLVAITYKAIGEAGSRSVVELQVLTFTDTDGKTLQSAAENGWVEIGDAPSPTPGPSPTPSATPGPPPTTAPVDYLAYLPSTSKP